ncbi:MAG: folylpolyglutamate synthase/dihydrofolate synthase family protein [Bacteroidota bacterium]|nr:folylpolyglutamate synthase/dihydrofolate synthase family protein [Bacteroidota bacterium]
MNYSDTLDFLYSSLPMYQRIGKAAYRSDLDNTIRLDNYFGKPHRAFNTIHIAGTNGKGSVSHILASVLQSAGYKTGLYTSPHFIDFRERIRVNGELAEKEYIVDFVKDNRDIIQKLEPSFFEMTVAMAFLYFKQKNVDVAVIETGMGGRLDSTNIVTPLLSVITNIGFDHTQYLGNTLEKIAAEKAGIIKNQVPVVIGQTGKEVRKVFNAKAREMDADIYFADDNFSVEKVAKGHNKYEQVFNIYRNGLPFVEDLYTDLTGDYQALNIITFMQAFELMKNSLELNTDSLRSGVGHVKENTGLMGRWQIMRKSPLVICDSAHNYDGLSYAISQLMKMKGGKLHFIIGMVNDKDVDSILGLFPDDAEYYFTRASIPRALDHEILRGKAIQYSLRGNAFHSVGDAYNSALSNAEAGDIIFIGGSIFVVADFLKNFSSK